MREVLVVATKNRGKLMEFRALLGDLPLEIRSVSELLEKAPEVVEDGTTFEENAIKKAVAVARATMTLTLADDSGLEVDVLGGRPGVRSARFAHDRATDAENNAALMRALSLLGDATAAASTEHVARFRCVLALVDPFSTRQGPLVVAGMCEGSIASAPRGVAGFGYDPLFVVASLGKTMAELSDSEKNLVSHRCQAVRALRPMLESVLEERRALVAKLDHLGCRPPT